MMINIFILLAAFIAAKILSDTYDGINRLLENRQKRKDAKNDILRWKIQKVFAEYMRHYSAIYDRESAYNYTCNMLDYLRKTNQLEEKYQLLKMKGAINGN